MNTKNTEDLSTSFDEKMWTYFQNKVVKEFSYGKTKRMFLIKKIKRLIKPNSRILEIGFGTGDILSELCNSYECYGADISPQNIKQIEDKLKKVKFSLLDEKGDFPFIDDYLDAFIASEVLEHMTSNQLDKCLSEILRVLKPGGSAVITFPAEEDLKNEECYCPRCELVFHRFGHKQSWSKDRIRNFFSAFDDIEIIEYFHKYPYNNYPEKILSSIMWLAQKSLNYITKIPNKIFGNRVYIVILKKK
jgi:ubiquinone/menaquinone biosynthesis C-methylase UbiE